MPTSVYFQSWSSSWSNDSTKLDLANISKDIKIVYLSFASPTTTYVKGQNSFEHTGITFSSDFNVVKGAIKILTDRGVLVMLSVGGATYHFPKPFTTTQAKSLWFLNEDLGCSGIDIDWEPSDGIKSEVEFRDIIFRFNETMIDRKRKLSAAVFSVGAYAPTSANPNCGMNIYGLNYAGSCLDWINLMAYDAGNKKMYKVPEAYEAYKKLYSRPVYIGLEVGTQAWGGYLLTMSDVQEAIELSKGNIFIWSLQKESVGTPTPLAIIAANKKL